MAACEPGKGSTFHFTAKLHKAQQQQSKVFSKVKLAGKRVLIVDDNPEGGALAQLAAPGPVARHLGLEVQVLDCRQAHHGVGGGDRAGSDDGRGVARYGSDEMMRGDHTPSTSLPLPFHFPSTSVCESSVTTH